MRLRRTTSRICSSSNRFMGDWMMRAEEKWQEMRGDWCWRVRAGAAEATPKDYRSGHTLRSHTAGSQDESRCGAIQRKAKDLTQRAQRKTGEHRERSRHTANSKVSASAKNRPRRHRGKLGQPFDPAPRDLRMNRAEARFTRSAPTNRCPCRGARTGRLGLRGLPVCIGRC